MTTSHSDASHAMPAGCGERLRRAREAAGLGVDEVAARLHMPARVVRSLEAEDWARLGAPVFVRGQVRSYSRLLGLLTAPMMEAIDVGPVEPSRLVSRTHTPKAQWWAEQIGRRLVYILLTLSLAIPAWIATREHLATGGGNAAPLDMPIGAAPAPANPRTVVASMTPPVAAAAAAPAAAATDAIVLRLRGDSWLEVTAPDGSHIEQGLLPAGTERRYAPGQVGRLVIGNAAAADLLDRGRPVAVAAQARANVARFTVSSDGSLVAVD
jgi:cytoskeleton protein RodZ